MGSSLRATAFILVLIFFCVFAEAEAGSGDVGFGVSLISGLSGGSCNGSIADCLGEDEFEMDSEASRRILASKDRITRRAVNNGGKPAAFPANSGKSYNKGCRYGNRC